MSFADHLKTKSDEQLQQGREFFANRSSESEEEREANKSITAIADAEIARREATSTRKGQR